MERESNNEIIPGGFVRLVDNEGNFVEDLMEFDEPIMEYLPIEILEAIQDWALEKHPDHSVIIK